MQFGRVRTYTIELACEDLEHDQREAELAETGTNVGAFESALSGADFDEFLWREHNAPGSMQAKPITRGSSMSFKHDWLSHCVAETSCRAWVVSFSY